MARRADGSSPLGRSTEARRVSAFCRDDAIYTKVHPLAYRRTARPSVVSEGVGTVRPLNESRNMSLRIRGRSLWPVAAMSLAATLIISFTAPVYALDGQADVEEVSALIQEVAPGAKLAARGVVNSSASSVNVDGITTRVPLNPESDIVVSDDAGNRVSLGLPDELTVGKGVVADDGTVVYADATQPGDAVAVQTLSDGSTRVQTVIAGADSPHEFSYSLSGYMPAVSDRGEAMFYKADGDFVPVAAAWARDANGNDVPTSYEVRGGKLVQLVEPTADTVYPIVADPSWVWIGAGWGMKLTRTETSRSRDYAAAVGMCGIFARSAPGFTVGCSVWGSYVQLQANLAQGDNPRTCLFFNVVPAPGSIWRVKC